MNPETITMQLTEFLAPTVRGTTQLEWTKPGGDFFELTIGKTLTYVYAKKGREYKGKTNIEKLKTLLTDCGYRK